tara:strand:- start:220 stop:1191 length:972 start_codon:yes stop_codon:yes gene_type:complete
MAVLTALAIGAGVSAIGGAVGVHAAGKAAGKARTAQDRARRELEAAKRTRATITNPYAGVKDLSSMAKDLTGQLSNPFASLGVATGAAEIQMEQTDMALANTLDTLRATGSGAGGATALAQAALQSKKGVAANIEQQEASNEKMRAQGEQALQQQKISEQQRLQNVAISEGQRVQSSDAAGKQFMFEKQESRTNMDMNRAAGQQQQAQQQEADANAAKSAAIGGAIGSIGNLAGATIGAAGNTEGGMKALLASDRRLKENIKLISTSLKGLNIYAFEYIDKFFGEGTWQGVMSDEIPQDAVIKHKDGYDRVDYSKLDVIFKQI